MATPPRKPPRRSQWGVLVALAMVLVAVAAGASLLDDGGSVAERVEAGPRPSTAPVLVLGATAEQTTAPTTLPALSSATTVRPTTTVAPGRSAAPPVATTAATTAATTPPASAVTATASTTTLAPTTTAAPVVTCRNSTDPACGPFRFDPQPGPDRAMTVQVVAEPASPKAGQEVVFHLTLVDPDGVSYGSTLFGFGDSGTGDSKVVTCEKFGAWTPPAPDPGSATEVQTIRHTYAAAGTYTASFAFDAGPFGCVDSVTGRGDRPYASSGTGVVPVVVG